VQTASRLAAAVHAVNKTDDLSRAYRPTGLHERTHWLVLCAQTIRVVDDENTAAGDPTCESNDAPSRGQDSRSLLVSKVDTEVARSISRQRRFERDHHPRRACRREPVRA
jgi:hypothetical protein